MVEKMGGFYRLMYYFFFFLFLELVLMILCIKKYCLVRCMYMYIFFDEVLGMIFNLFLGWLWIIMLFLNNNYVIVFFGKIMFKDYRIFFLGI